MMNEDWYEPGCEIEVVFNPHTRCVQVSDTFGFFRPFSLMMWKRFVEVPYQTMKKHGYTKERVIEIFLGDFHYMYCCKN